MLKNKVKKSSSVTKNIFKGLEYFMFEISSNKLHIILFIDGVHY